MFRKKIRTASSTLPALPSFPSSEQIEADLDAASGHDAIFVTQVPDNLTETQFHLRFQNQQLDTAGSDNDVEVVDLPLYDKVIAHNLNLERLKSLKTRLSNALETLDKETPQIEEGTETLQKLLSDTKDKFEDVKSLKTFSRPRQ